MPEISSTRETILVVGGGIAGMTAAVEAAECGKEVILLEKSASLGGRTARLYRYFPKLCRPSCGQEINQRRIKARVARGNLRVLTMAELGNLSGKAGDYTAEVVLQPRYVNENCTACGACAEAVSAEVADAHNYGLGKVKAAYLPNAMAYPYRYVLDAAITKGKGRVQGEAAKAACAYDAIDLDAGEERVQVRCGAVIFATGWKPYDAGKIQPYGYGRIANVISSVEFERLADPAGPTGGELRRPSDGKLARNVAFIQCAGSRDKNHLAHCSRICCMASLKQAAYVREKYPEGAAEGEGGKEGAAVTIYYIDIRTIDRFEDFERRIRADAGVRFVKSKVASVEVGKDGDPVLCGVDTHGYERYANAHDLVVLAVGMEPSLDVKGIGGDAMEGVGVGVGGFIEGGVPGNGGGGVLGSNGVFAAGCAGDTLDVNRAVQSATAAALRAIQVVNRAGAGA